jgi:predicted enzyme related to lactoylglutathione lyase
MLILTLDAHDALRLAQFWAGLLGRKVVEEPAGALVPGDDTQVGLRFVPSDSVKAGPNRVHLHLTSTDLADQERTVATALDLGAGHLDVGQLPEEGHIVLADPEGNEFCVIEPGNSFLAGCGFLGELACDGTRAVGVFWSEALGWPLVWDQDEETAIQSPQGGTKVAWGGPPLAAKRGRNRQRFELALTDGEIDRLVTLGATRLGAAELADPDGNEFTVVPRQ